MSDGKNAPGLRGFPTPNSVAGTSGYTVFRFPNDPAWGQLLLGAAQMLAYAWNWYESGDLTPEEAADAFRQIVEQAPYEACACTLPDGGRVIRINPTTGHLEELGDDGDWHEPTGDYAVPPITPRTGGTPEDQRCLASANAAHVLELLYESITDSIAHELETAEAYAALVTAFIAAVGWEFAPIAFAIAAFFLTVFGIVYEIVKIIGADLWDDTFTETLKCALYGCSSDDGEGVITFDWLCLQNALAAGTNALNFDQLRLFNQLYFIIQVLGGADGLNQAGATTSITDADCSECVPTAWGYEWNADELASWDNCFGRGAYSAGVGWVAGVGAGFVASTPNSGNNSDLHANPNHWEIDVTASGAAGNGYVSVANINDVCTFTPLDPGYASLDGVPTYPGYGLQNGAHTYTYDDDGLHDFSGVFVNAVINDEDAALVVTRVRLSGTGAPPPFTGGHPVTPP